MSSIPLVKMEYGFEERKSYHQMEADFLSQYIFDPSKYMHEVLGAKLEKWQEQANDMLLKNRFVAIRSGNGVGKTAWLAMLIIWFLNTQKMSIVPCTANSATQLETVLWAEIYRWMTRSSYVMQKLEWTTNRINVRGHKQAWYAIARTAVNSNGIATEALQGFHADYLLYVVDEASGVPDKAVDALESATTKKNNYGVMCSNPTRRSGIFFRAFHQDRDLWGNIHVRPEDSTIMTEEFKQRMERKYRGVHATGYKMRVLGEFPDAENLGIVSYNEYNDPDVQIRGVDVKDILSEQEQGTAILSVDPAGSGPESDASTIGIRVGNCIIDIASFHKLKTHELAAKVKELADTYQAKKIFVDAIGIGDGLANNLLQLYDQDIPENPRIYKVHVGMRASDPRGFYNRRSELYYHAGQAIKEKRIKILTDLPYLEQDLTELHYYYETQTQRYRVESKEEFRRRNDGKSTDFGDAFTLLFSDVGMEDEQMPIKKVDTKTIGVFVRCDEELKKVRHKFGEWQSQSEEQ